MVMGRWLVAKLPNWRASPLYIQPSGQGSPHHWVPIVGTFYDMYWLHVFFLLVTTWGIINVSVRNKYVYFWLDDPLA